MASRQTFERMDDFVRRTRPALFVRRQDELLMIRPDKTMSLNHSATEILAALYARQGAPAAKVLSGLAPGLGVDLERLVADTEQLLGAVGAILNEDFSPRPGLRFGTYRQDAVAYPTLAEIALTYGCQNRCQFCYASSPRRGEGQRSMTTAEVCRVMDRIFHEGHVPSLSFTGGESTLRRDLPELVRYGADLGLRMNLITNGIRAAEPGYAETLVDAGLASAQVSLEAADPSLHDAIVGRQGAHAATVAGVARLRDLGIHVHTNTTLCSRNLAHAEEVVRFVARDLGLRTLSMNMVIRTGEARSEERIGVGYGEVAGRLPTLLETAEAEGVKLVWYSPIPYCLWNPVLHGLGAKSCACVGGILSVDPSGQLLPCSSFEAGLGSVLHTPFERLYRSRRARYWRERRYVPPPCAGCPDVDLCAGACPLYWDAAGSFAELPVDGADDPRAYERWAAARRRSRSHGVRPRKSVEAV
jgi:radical SAM protein with 4Fe4S-binding SPASM domain